MFRTLALALVGGAVVTGIAMTAQDRPLSPGTLYPGQPTPGRVWIQNQGETEAVPVQIVGTPTVVLREDTVVRTRAVGPIWEYMSVTIPGSQDLATNLNALGAAGWETTGIAMATPNGTLIVLKRPRL